MAGMSFLFAVVSFVAVFVLTFAAGVFMVAQVLPDRRGPPGVVVIAILLSLSLFTAYAVVIEHPISDCTEHSPQGSGIC